MHDILKQILEDKKSEVARIKQQGLTSRRRSDARRLFTDALRKYPAMAVIAEVKKASPSKGILRADFDPTAIALSYEKHGASALSVLTDEKYFMGSAHNLACCRDAVKLPVLRKDFIIDPLQVLETAGMNADALLLIAAALSDAQMAELYAAAGECDIEVLIEVHTLHEAERAMRLNPPLIGVNNRNLSTFQVSLDTTFEIVRNLPAEVLAVSESGIQTVGDIQKLLAARVSAVLVGESLVVQKDPGALIQEFIACL